MASPSPPLPDQAPTPELTDAEDFSSSSSGDDDTAALSHSHRRPLPALPHQLATPRPLKPATAEPSSFPFPVLEAAEESPSSLPATDAHSFSHFARAPKQSSHNNRVASWTRMQASAVHALKHPRILALLLSYLSWPDFYAFICTATKLRSLWDYPELKDVIMSAFVPGYHYALHQRDLSRFRDVDITLQDLDLLLISQRVPLHRYPMHALHALSSSPESSADTAMTRHISNKLAVLANTHSRFVLLLQSLVHSSSLPTPAEPPAFAPRPQSASQSSGAGGSLPHGMRELAFPAPLSESVPDGDSTTVSGSTNVPSLAAFPPTNVRATSSSPRNSRNLRSRHSKASARPSSSSAGGMSDAFTQGSMSSLANINGNSLSGSPRTMMASPLASPAPGHSGASTQAPSLAKGRRLSVFGSNGRSPPPAPAEPRSLRLYGESWRRSGRLSSALSPPPTSLRTYNRSPLARAGGFSSQDDFSFTKPFAQDGRRAASVDSDSTESGSGSSSPPFSRRSTAMGDVTRAFSSTRPRPGFSFNPNEPTNNPHDLTLAISRARAPVLRVFVSTGVLSPAVLNACEAQLIQGGLWPHLSTGDVVCNLGYVPGASSRPSTRGSESPASADGTSEQTWLVFDGTQLVPYIPPAPPPIADPLSLPSPFYYTHLLPAGTNPQWEFGAIGTASIDINDTGSGAAAPAGPDLRLSVGGLPLATVASMEPELTLTQTTMRVRSPHSLGGFAMVKKWVWIARSWVGIGAREAAATEAMGSGWRGEWVLEGEGTKEGRSVLLKCLKGEEASERYVWEMIKERSGGGKIRMRLIKTIAATTSGAASPVPGPVAPQLN